MKREASVKVHPSASLSEVKNSLQEPPSKPAWCLRYLSETNTWSTWPIQESPLLIGRSLGCHICIESPSVSRVQLEISLSNGALQLHNKGKTNATRINGVLCEATTLRLGDVIEFATNRFVVDELTSTEGRAQGDHTKARTTQRFDDSAFLSAQVPPTLENSQSFASDLLSLFNFLRELTRTASLDEVLDSIKQHLALRFASTHCWVALTTGSESELRLCPPPLQHELAEAPMKVLKAAMQSSEGICQPKGIATGTSILCAPLLVNGEVFGAIAIEYLPSSEKNAASALHYLLAVADGAAAIILACERMEQLKRDAAELRPSPLMDDFGLIGTSPAIAEVRQSIKLAASGLGHVMVLGETGVGKELAARAIHNTSARRRGPYVVVNCAAIPGELFESEFFGHERGAFTGASRARKGLLELAHGGTLFLDEVAELSQPNQARLLRVVESGTFRRVGSEQEFVVDVRIVSATNRPLLDSSHSSFRMDLFHRLAVYVVWIPPLRQRLEDLPELTNHFRSIFARLSSVSRPTLTDESLESLMRYSWPGNVRELKNVVERAHYAGTTEQVSPHTASLTPSMPDAMASSVSATLKSIERKHLLDALRTHKSNVAQTAEALGMAVSTLYYKLRQNKISLRNPE